jgi:hypothetical protein
MGSRSFTSDRDCIIQNASCNKFVVEPPLERPDALREDGGGEVFVGGTRGRNRCRLSPRRRAWTRRRRARRLPFPRPSPRETSVRPPLSHPAARVQVTRPGPPSPCPSARTASCRPARGPSCHPATARQPSSREVTRREKCALFFLYAEEPLQGRIGALLRTHLSPSRLRLISR